MPEGGNPDPESINPGQDFIPTNQVSLCDCDSSCSVGWLEQNHCLDLNFLDLDFPLLVSTERMYEQ